jgi:YesN/AraC family two-component response regulator
MRNDSDLIQHYSKALREIAFEMKVLLVEDDVAIQQQLKSFLLRFFSHVDTANHGFEALELYDAYPYDFIITDLTMPLMGGIELSAHIRGINPNQKILVVSAHSESEKLIELINIGVDGFMLKPINVTAVLEVLSRTCQSIYDHKMLHYFNTLLEQTNNELKMSNIALESALNELQRAKEFTSSEPLISNGISSSIENFYLDNVDELERANEELEELEDDFNLLLVSSDTNTNHNLLKALNILLKQYAHQIHIIPQFQAIAYKLMDLTHLFDTIHEEAEKMPFLVPSVTSLFDHLEQWRRGIFIYRNVDNIHYMDEYLIETMGELQTSIEHFK